MRKSEIVYSVDNGVRRKLSSKSHKVCVGNYATPMAEMTHTALMNSGCCFQLSVLKGT